MSYLRAFSSIVFVLALAGCGALLIAAPVLAKPLGVSWGASVLVSTVGAFLAGAASHAARTFWISRPAGLSSEPVSV